MRWLLGVTDKTDIPNSPAHDMMRGRFGKNCCRPLHDQARAPKLTIDGQETHPYRRH
jgi:hypothetical protein